MQLRVGGERTARPPPRRMQLRARRRRAWSSTIAVVSSVKRDPAPNTSASSTWVFPGTRSLWSMRSPCRVREFTLTSTMLCTEPGGRGPKLRSATARDGVVHQAAHAQVVGQPAVDEVQVGPLPGVAIAFGDELQQAGREVAFGAVGIRVRRPGGQLPA